MKILHFPSKKTIWEWLREAESLTDDGDKAMIVILKPDGTVLSGWHQLNFSERMVILGHIYADILHSSIEATFDVQKRED
jgi:hypothetical protein